MFCCKSTHLTLSFLQICVLCVLTQQNQHNRLFLHCEVAWRLWSNLFDTSVIVGLFSFCWVFLSTFLKGGRKKKDVGLLRRGTISLVYGCHGWSAMLGFSRIKLVMCLSLGTKLFILCFMGLMVLLEMSLLLSLKEAGMLCHFDVLLFLFFFLGGFLVIQLCTFLSSL